ncbi:F-box/LRR-repeat protein 16 [Tetrabaena socialis]|uniref:Dynein axonemal assembly factor 4 n=1 Tax=Tetrabaena socialis TaxID=47790 RepID=A0A2J8A2C2_9CHLO|nr:F-box/LRR-repeat protein 16 [Tetrabaena socialis]|eukprot:PNH06669.1 F-box/LRR-repeat protein 16 [Tetrabaena socialis]
MPLTPQYTWSETEASLEVTVEVPGVSGSKADVFASDAFLKINCPPYLFALDLHKEVDDSRSSATIVPRGVVFKLFKPNMGNVCLRLRPAGRGLPAANEDASPSRVPHEPAYPPPSLWRPHNLKEMATRPSDTLQDLCIAAVVGAWDTIPVAAVEALPSDLMQPPAAPPLDPLQRVFDELVATGRFALSDLARFKELDLDTVVLIGRVDVKDERLRSLDRCSRLRSLDLTGCSQLGDKGVEALRLHRGLRHLKLNHCVAITDAAMQHLRGLTGLQELELRGCEGLTGEGLMQLAGLTGLRRLDLDQCVSIKGGLQHLTHLLRLTSLRLGWCSFLTDMEVAWLRPPWAAELRELTLAHTQVGWDAWLWRGGGRPQEKAKAAGLKPQGLNRFLHFGSGPWLRLERARTSPGPCLARPWGSGLELPVWAPEHAQREPGACTRAPRCGTVSTSGAPLPAVVGGGAVGDEGLAGLASLRQLTRLDLTGCARLTDAAALAIARMSALQVLSLDRCDQIGNTGWGMGGAGRPVGGRVLSLNHTAVTSACCRELGGLQWLQSLSLCGTRVGEAAVARLKARAHPHLIIKHSPAPPAPPARILA